MSVQATSWPAENLVAMDAFAGQESVKNGFSRALSLYSLNFFQINTLVDQ